MSSPVKGDRDSSWQSVALNRAEIINPLLAYINLPLAYIELTLVKACATIMDV